MMGDTEQIVPSFEHRREDDLPEGWTYLALGNAGEWGSGGTPSKSRAEFWDRGTVPWVSPKDMKVSFIGDAQDHITQHAVSSGAAGLVPPGTILFVVRGMILAHTFPVALTTHEVAFNQDMRSIVADAGLHPPYLLRVLQHEAMSILFAVKEATHGTLRLDSDTLRPWPIPVPPLPEQRRIVTAVEALLEQVNRARERLDRVPLILKRFRQAVLSAACSGRLTEEWREEHPADSAEVALRVAAKERRETWLAGAKSRKATNYVAPPPPTVEGDQELPDSWRWTNGRAMFLWGSGAFLPQTKMKAGPVPVYGGNGISGYHDEPMVTKRTLVVGRVGALCGNVHVTAGSAWITDNAIFAPWIASVLNLDFARMVLASRNLNANAGGSGQPFVSQELLDSQVFPFPPPDEQAAVVLAVARLNDLADSIERRVQTATAGADKLPQAILSKAFSGELVPTEADLARAEGRTYETAAELLARVAGEGQPASRTDRPAPKNGRLPNEQTSKRLHKMKRARL